MPAPAGPEAVTRPWDRVCIWGMGLIGGSVAAALRRGGAAREILAVDALPNHLRQALELGLVDTALSPEAPTPPACDLHLLALPVGACAGVLGRLAAPAAEGAVISDTGSTKGEMVELARRCLGAGFPRFVPGHPIAGAERSGPGAARADLFQDRATILTPVDETDADALGRVADLWRRLGARVQTMDPAHHDRVFAAVSHVPHAIAFAYVAMLAEAADTRDALPHAGSGFRDFSRIAAASPEMWRDVCASNRHQVARLLADFEERLAGLRRLLLEDDQEALLALIHRSRNARLSLPGEAGRTLPRAERPPAQNTNVQEMS